MAITSPTDVCNLAQKFLRQSPIGDIENPTSKNEVTYSLLYDQARRATLEMHPWNFATKRAMLGQSSDADKPTHGWAYASAILPIDFVRLNTIGQYDDWTPNDYSIENNRILSNNSAPYFLSYIYDFKDVSRMSALFINTFAKMLAALAAFDITGNASLQAVLEQSAKDDLEEAKTSDGQQRPPQRRQVSKWNTARRGFYRNTNPYFLGGGD